jgi:hypothetical protein
VDDFSKVSNPSVVLIFLTFMVVISWTLPALKYMSSAIREYFSGSEAQNLSI